MISLWPPPIDVKRDFYRRKPGLDYGWESCEEKGTDVVAQIETRDPFTHRWPETEERYDQVFVVRLDNPGPLEFTVGFCDKQSFGPRRRHGVVFLHGEPLVEFSAADDFERSFLMTSVVKDVSGKHVPATGEIPDEYLGWELKPFNTLIGGPHAFGSLAVVVAAHDVESMARHALIRAKQRGMVRE